MSINASNGQEKPIIGWKAMSFRRELDIMAKVYGGDPYFQVKNDGTLCINPTHPTDKEMDNIALGLLDDMDHSVDEIIVDAIRRVG